MWRGSINRSFCFEQCALRWTVDRYNMVVLIITRWPISDFYKWRLLKVSFYKNETRVRSWDWDHIFLFYFFFMILNELGLRNWKRIWNINSWDFFIFYEDFMRQREEKIFREKGCYRDVISVNLMQYNLYSSSCCGESEWNVQNSRTDVSRNTWREYRSRVFYSSSCVHDKYLSSMSNDYSLRRGIDNSLTILLRFTRVL